MVNGKVPAHLLCRSHYLLYFNYTSSKTVFTLNRKSVRNEVRTIRMCIVNNVILYDTRIMQLYPSLTIAPMRLNFEFSTEHAIKNQYNIITNDIYPLNRSV